MFILTSIFMTEGRVVAEDKNDPLIKGYLSIKIQSITGTPVTGTCFTVELYNIWESRFLSKNGYTPQYVEWTGTEISLDYRDIDTRTEIELMIFENDKTQSPVGAVWLRLIDILHSSNVVIHRDGGSTTVDTWFRLAPKGKIRLKLVFSELVSSQSLVSSSLY
ncbi:hypothetical protein EIK77_007458 [Talaromyces pinophilus]|nr:hypothetical protein EIK77_007458 [Talaromyces pinophilus]